MKDYGKYKVVSYLNTHIHIYELQWTSEPVLSMFDLLFYNTPYKLATIPNGCFVEFSHVGNVFSSLLNDYEFQLSPRSFHHSQQTRNESNWSSKSRC